LKIFLGVNRYENTYLLLRQETAACLKIVRVFPNQKVYCESFIGGAAIFFAKPQSQAEIINDVNSEVINFYEVLQHDFPALQSEISISLHSRKLHQHAQVTYDNPDMFDRIKRPWTLWYFASVSFGCNLTAGFGYDKCGTRTKVIRNKLDHFTEELAECIQNVQIECCDALKIIRSRNSVDTLFYLDPPYIGSNQGHYNDYWQPDFDALLEQLEKKSKANSC